MTEDLPASPASSAVHIPDPKIMSADAYLRAPSAGLVPEQMIRFKRIELSCDMIDDAVTRLQILADRFGARPPENNWTLAAILSPCWTIVQQVYALRNELSKLPLDNLPAVRQVIVRYEHVSRMRNLLDHLTTQAKNFAKKKEIEAPVFGAFNYSVWEPGSQNGVNGGVRIRRKLVGIAGGPKLNNTIQNHSFGSHPRSKVIRYPVSWFQFFAGDDLLEIDDLQNDFAEAIQELDERAKRVIPESIRQAHSERGLSLRNALKPGGGNNHFVAEITTDLSE